MSLKNFDMNRDYNLLELGFGYSPMKEDKLYIELTTFSITKRGVWS